MGTGMRETPQAIVIGASAGGVGALSALLPQLDPRARYSALVVLHLRRERDSLLPQLFARQCAMTVREAEDKDPVRPGHIYFAPPDYHLLVEGGEASGGAWLALSVDEPEHFSRPSIDVLFESAAECWRERVVGILLSGANEDGAMGLACIARAGGVTIVQDPAEAEVPRMPAAALEACPGIDHVLPVATIGRLLRDLVPIT